MDTFIRNNCCIVSIALLFIAIQIVCTSHQSMPLIGHSMPYLDNVIIKNCLRNSIPDLEKYSATDPNFSVWKESIHMIKSKPNLYKILHDLYGTDQMICINANLKEITQARIEKANYRTLVITTTNQRGEKKKVDLKEVFFLLEYLLSKQVQIDNIVLYDLNSSVLKNSYNNTSMTKVFSTVEIAFHDNDIPTCNAIGEYLVCIFKNMKVRIICDNFNVGDLSGLDERIIPKIVELTTREAPTIEQYGIIRKMVRIESLWITGYRPCYLSTETPKTSISDDSNVLHVKNLYISIDALSFYTSSLLSTIKPTKRLILLTFPIRQNINLDAKKISIKDISIDFAHISDGIDISFGILYGNQLGPSIMGEIVSLICKFHMKGQTHTIYIEKIPSLATPDYSIVQIPLYYIARSIYDKEKLDRYKIIVSPGGNASNIQLKPVPLWKNTTQPDRDAIIEQSTVVIKREVFLKNQSSFVVLDKPIKGLPRSIFLLLSKSVGTYSKCMICKESFRRKRNILYSSRDESIMLYACGHASCGLCGYNYVSKGFIAPPRCKICKKIIESTMIYIPISDHFKKLDDMLSSPPTYLFDALDYLGSGFLFSYGTSDSSILYDIGNIFITESNLLYKWTKHPVEKSFSYLVATDDKNSPKYAINVCDRTHTIKILMNILVDSSMADNISLYICKKKRSPGILTSMIYTINSFFDPLAEYRELLSDKNKGDFLFLYKFSKTRELNDKIVDQLEKNLGSDLEKMTILCSSFWKANRWS